MRVGLATAGAFTAGPLWGKLGPEVVSEPEWAGPPGEEKEIFSVCQMCPDGCGIKIRIYEGRAVKVEGNPGHPLNQGGLCPRGQASLQLLYHPERLKYPLLNTGAKGQGIWQRMTFEEAMGISGEKLNNLLRNRSTHHLTVASGSVSGLDEIILRRFCSSIGTPNYIKFDSLGRKAMSTAMGLTHGIYSPPGIDWSNCDYLILFGAEPGATDVSPMWFTRGFGELRRGRAGRRSKIVHVSTRYSLFSSKADEWIKINPGTYGALALGIAHVIIREEKYNSDFIDRFTLGFEDAVEIDSSHKPGYKNHILKNYSPETVESITGVPAETIIRLSEEFAAAKPGVAYGGDSAASYSNAVTELVSIHSLNALVGSIDVPGGVMMQQPPPLKMPKEADINQLFINNLKQERVDGMKEVSGLPIFSRTTGLASRLADKYPYPIELLILADFNPVAFLPDSGNWEKALAKVPFVISFSNFIDESSRFADLIIPGGTFFERWDGKEIDGSTGFPVYSLSRPIFDKPLGGMDISTFILGLAGKMGSAMTSLFPWQSTEDLLKEMVSGLNSSPGSSEPWDELVEKGYWSDGPYSFGHQKQVYKARGNRFNFYLYTMEKASSALFESGFKSPGASQDGFSLSDFLPNHIPPEFSDLGSDYPLHLEIFATPVSGHGRYYFLDCLQEIQELGLNKSYGRWVMINHRTADNLRIQEGDSVWVASSKGKISAVAKIIDGMSDDSAGMIFGQGRRIGEGSAGSESPFSLLADITSPIGGGICWSGTKVKITRI